MERPRKGEEAPLREKERNDLHKREGAPLKGKERKDLHKRKSALKEETSKREDVFYNRLSLY